MKVLWIDDEVDLMKPFIYLLNQEGYEVKPSTSGEDGLSLLKKEPFDIVFLDEIMPGIDGLEVLKKIKGKNPQQLVVMITKSEEEELMERAYSDWVDDYITKPFGAKELIARVGAVLRRHKSGEEKPEPGFQLGELVVNFAGHNVTVGGQEIDLTATEYRILSYLAQNAGQLLTPDTILRKVWGEEYQGENHLLQVNISRLRKKLEDDGRNPRYILTRPGIGYMVSKA